MTWNYDKEEAGVQWEEVWAKKEDDGKEYGKGVTCMYMCVK